MGGPANGFRFGELTEGGGEVAEELLCVGIDGVAASVVEVCGFGWLVAVGETLLGRPRVGVTARWGRGGEVGGADGDEVALEFEDVLVLGDDDLAKIRGK